MNSISLLNRKPKKHISLTALVDVVFILLFFFMLTSSFTQLKGIELKSPISADHSAEKIPQLITIHQNGSLSLYGNLEKTSLSDKNLLKAININQPTVVLPEQQSTVQSIVSAIERLHKLGINQLSLGKSLQATTDTSGK